MDQQYLDNRIEYFKNLQNVIKNDRELLINMKALPKEHQDKFYKMINEGGNKGRLDVYNKIDMMMQSWILNRLLRMQNLKIYPRKQLKEN
jgi:hypothetical protein